MYGDISARIGLVAGKKSMIATNVMTDLASSFSEIRIPFRFQNISSGASPDVSHTSVALSPFRTDNRTKFSWNLGGAGARKN